jgi:hypothetical protein
LSVLPGDAVGNDSILLAVKIDYLLQRLVGPLMSSKSTQKTGLMDAPSSTCENGFPSDSREGGAPVGSGLPVEIKLRHPPAFGVVFKFHQP